MILRQKNEMLAFVHIEKAAGTTLLYLLRRNLLGRYLDVRPLRKREPAGVFTADDLRLVLRINPWLRAIGGHAVQPAPALCAAHGPRRLRFVTVLRNPVDRYLSQFRYWNRVMGKGWTFERFLDHEPSWDMQTRKLAGGKRDADAALACLRDRFALVGTVEALDEFLLCLAAAMPGRFDPHYRRRNAGDDDRAEADRLLQRHGDAIVARNAADQVLYTAVTTGLLPRQRAAYPGDLDTDLARFRAAQASDAPVAEAARTAALWTDGLLRKAWYEPVTGWLRRRHGLPARGSY